MLTSPNTPQSNCTHPRWVAVESSRIAAFFPKNSKFSALNLFIISNSIRSCVKCGAVILLENDVIKTDDLKDIGEALTKSLRRMKNMTISFDEGKQEIKELPKNIGKPAEEASFSVITPRFGLENVILNTSTLEQVEEAQIKTQYAHILYKEFGFEKIRPYGNGTVLNFYGPPGTGKTRTAEAFAGFMGMKFLDVNIADLESRYMSQTGKNIQLAFETASRENAVIFFDEADTVLGKRLSAVTQGIDAEINMSRSTMLKELERFGGICIFATNFSENIDRAFIRRISYHVEFGLPEQDALTRLWDYMLLDTFPLAENRTALIEKLVAQSKGLSGADIATVIEHAFAKAFRANAAQPIFQEAMLAESIKEVKKSTKIVANNRLEATKNLLGLDGQ